MTTRLAAIAIAVAGVTFALPGVAGAQSTHIATAPARDTPPKPRPAPKPAAKPAPKPTTAPKPAPKPTTPPKPPKGAKFLCKDGTYSFVKSARSACVGHRGVERAV